MLNLLYSGFQTTAAVRASSSKSCSSGCFAPPHPQGVLPLGFSLESEYLSVYGCLGTMLFLLQLSGSGKEARLEQSCDLAPLNAAFAGTVNFVQCTTVLSLFQVVFRTKRSPTQPQPCGAQRGASNYFGSHPLVFSPE